MSRWRWPFYADSHKRRYCCTRIASANTAHTITKLRFGGIASCPASCAGDAAIENFFHRTGVPDVLRRRFVGMFQLQLECHAQTDFLVMGEFLSIFMLKNQGG